MTAGFALRHLAFALVVGLFVGACGAAPGDASGDEDSGGLESAEQEWVAAAYDSSVCGRIDTAPYADLLGMDVPPLEVTTDAPRLPHGGAPRAALVGDGVGGHPGRPDATDAQLEAILRDLAALGG